MGQGRADGRDTGPQQLCLPCAGPFRKSVSSCQRLVSGTSCRRRSWGAGASQSRQRRAPGPPVELLVDWARLSGSQPVAQGEVQAEPSRLGRGGGQQEPQLWGSSVSDPPGGCGDSLPTAATMGLTELLTAQERPLAHVDGGASEGPGPLSPPVGHLPSPQALRSSSPRIPPVLRVSCFGVRCPSLGLRLTEESRRTVWPSAKSSCLSQFIRSTTQECDLRADL